MLIIQRSSPSNVHASSRRGVMYHSAKIDSGVRYPPYSQHTFERKIVSRLTP